MKGAAGMGFAAIFVILALSSHCSGLLHTAEPLPAGQLGSQSVAPSGRHLLQAPRRAHDVEDALEEEALAMSELEIEEELLSEAEAEAEADAAEEALSLDTERVTKEAASGKFWGLSTANWPTFGVVGEKQAALYYSVCLLFTVFFFKNSGLRYSLMIARANSHGKSARLGA